MVTSSLKTLTSSEDVNGSPPEQIRVAITSIVGLTALSAMLYLLLACRSDTRGYFKAPANLSQPFKQGPGHGVQTRLHGFRQPAEEAHGGGCDRPTNWGLYLTHVAFV